MSWGKKVPIGASTDTSFTSNFDLFDAVLQLFEAVNMKRVDMSTSSAIGEVACIFQVGLIHEKNSLKRAFLRQKRGQLKLV